MSLIDRLTLTPDSAACQATNQAINDPVLPALNEKDAIKPKKFLHRWI